MRQRRVSLDNGLSTVSTIRERTLPWQRIYSLGNSEGDTQLRALFRLEACERDAKVRCVYYAIKRYL